MNRKAWMIGLCLGLAGLLAGTVGGRIIIPAQSYVPPLKVIGDVRNCLTVQDLGTVGKVENINWNGTEYQAVRLADLIGKADPVAQPDQLHFVCLDGFTSVIKADGIEDCYIAFTVNNGWEAVNLKHPVNSNVKMLNEIVVVSDGDTAGFAFQFISPDANLAQFTPGQLLAGSLREYPYAAGTATIQNSGRYYESTVFTRRRVFKPSDFISIRDGGNMLVMGETGVCRLVSQGYFEVKDNSMNYIQPDARTTLEKVRGVIVNPPAASIMDTYYDCRHFLESGDKMLIIAVEGLTYSQYTYAANNGYAPFLQHAGQVMQATGVYPLQARVGLAALLTGKDAADNGVTVRNDKSLNVDSIFGEAIHLHKKAAYIEADPQLLNVEVQPLLVSDRNGDGNVDDDLYNATLANLSQDYDLIMVHFHDVSTRGELNGEIAAETLRSIQTCDQYIAGIISKWPGKVIITGEQRYGPLDGTRGAFTNLTMFVPNWHLK